MTFLVRLSAFVTLVLLLLIGGVTALAPALPGTSMLTFATWEGMFTFRVIDPNHGATFTIARNLEFNTLHAISHDGRQIITVAEDPRDAVLRFFIRRIDLYRHTNHEVPTEIGLPAEMTWTADGALLALMNSGDIHIMDADTGAVHSLYRIHATDITLAPDRCCLVYTHYDGIYHVDLETGEGVQLAASQDGVPTYSQPRFSPDGSQLVYVADAPRHRSDEDGLFVMQLATRERRELTPDRVRGVDYPSWSADGQHIAYTGLVGGQSDIFVVNLRTGNTRQDHPRQRL